MFLYLACMVHTCRVFVYVILVKSLNERQYKACFFFKIKLILALGFAQVYYLVQVLKGLNTDNDCAF